MDLFHHGPELVKGNTWSILAIFEPKFQNLVPNETLKIALFLQTTILCHFW